MGQKETGKKAPQTPEAVKEGVADNEEVPVEDAPDQSANPAEGSVS